MRLEAMPQSCAAVAGRFLLLAGACLALLTGCANTGGIVPASTPVDAATVDPGSALRATQQDAGWPQRAWWTRLGDHSLDALVAHAVAGSPDMRIAQARSELALSQAKIAGAAIEPNFNAGGAFGRTRFPRLATPQPLGGHTTWNNHLAVDLSYDLDLWGRNRAALQGALDNVQAAAADARMAQLSLETSVVRAYIDLALQYALLDVSQANLARQTRIYDIIRKRASRGLASELELSQTHTPIPALQAQVQQSERAIALVKNQLAVLSGDGPGAGDRLPRPALVLEAPIAVPASLPAELVGHRPDVVAQRWRVEAAAQGMKVAKADFYPNINLVASIGLASAAFGNFFTFVDRDAIGHNVGAAISLPIFDGGRRQGNYGAATRNYDIAVETYNKTVLAAFQSVADEVISLQSLTQQQAGIQDALRSARQAYGLAERGYRSGFTDYLNVLAADNELRRQQFSLALVQAARLDAWALLMQALGGGFDSTAVAEQP
ncbi:fusaric acid resistance protein FusA (plasmid) [Cupriavidus necator N-1]|uniref:Fusaric acid resistance protein FusA n=1 Tax=Cupriavidus necator (strain ATCC 43291 / DSM 13513 / CCUG 52238 / LMG 8453 / N-1) TaxID=1042878 RepID=F8GYA8_CUPNN|nr:efflux transporter outer membrane subunit [Cupriavidus necator]AEI82849.1 fusaric acid resistance protein FusA [Cupriavidus necator N-1]MDX6008647.1 efflux transporter outer membrane subunit [Cupriavidus necator]